MNILKTIFCMCGHKLETKSDKPRCHKCNTYAKYKLVEVV